VGKLRPRDGEKIKQDGEKNRVYLVIDCMLSMFKAMGLITTTSKNK
jgi:hypothetical protein